MPANDTRSTMKILIIQTAFLGDVILTLPLAQALRRAFADATIHMVAIPGAAGIVTGSPAINRTIVFDKKGSQRGIRELLRFGSLLREERYDAVLTPHRSLRTALLALMSGARIRVGFRNSAGWPAYTHRVEYPREGHEVDRNLQLLHGLQLQPGKKEAPLLEPTADDRSAVEAFLQMSGLPGVGLVAIAPGSVWFTKRWPAHKYAMVIRALESEGHACVIIGGAEDRELSAQILSAAGAKRSVSAAGTLTLLQSAELIRRARVLVTNDSAPLHIGVAVRTRVIAIFGPTVPAFGFSPYGEHDIVVERGGLACRPCTKHGGPSCPIGTFECMESIQPEEVLQRIRGGESPAGAVD